MSAEKTVSERDATRRERVAFARGVRSTGDVPRHIVQECCCPRCSLAQTEAAREYQLPKVSRPRVVQDPHGAGVLWRARADVIECHTPFKIDSYTLEGAWKSEFGFLATGPRVALWADLLARPDELVDDDA